MKTRLRYTLVAVAAAVYLLLLLLLSRQSPSDAGSPSCFDGPLNDEPLPAVQRVIGSSLCTMTNCFNFSRCTGERLKVYVYPEQENNPPSETYAKILRVIRESAFYTEKAEEACLLVLSLDTIDRDIRSKDNFVHGMPILVSSLPADVWRGGENHIIFNLYHGTYPDYADHNLGFDTGKAIVARASASAQNFRFGFDLSFPLFHVEHPIRDSLQRGSFSLRDANQFLVSFKGKRYVYGIGSETRDSLHYLHQNITLDGGEQRREGRVAMLTTCRHNNDWEAYKDDRCLADNAEFDKWDYEGLMLNSSFCLTPRGRRLGSYRFLESLRVGCVPVVLSDDWQLPFGEIIDWNAAVVRCHEKNVLMVTEVLSSFPSYRILKMRQRARLLYHRYFASVEKITLAALEMVWHRTRSSITGSAPPNHNHLLPFPVLPGLRYRLIVVVRASERSSGRLQTAMHNVAALPGVQKVVVLWPRTRGSMPVGADFGLSGVDTRLVLVSNATELPLSAVLGEEGAEGGEGGANVAFLFLSDRSSATREQLLRMAELFSGRPSAIITRDAIDWQGKAFESQEGISANVALLHATLVHSGYLSLLPSFLPPPLLAACPEASLSLLVSSLSLSPPLLFRPLSLSPDHWDTRHLRHCMVTLAQRWPLPPQLASSSIRIQ